MAADPTALTAALPSFPWDALSVYRDLAAERFDEPVDLSIGAPVDRVAPAVRAALADAADWPGYPDAHGTVELRTAYADWLGRAHGVDVNPGEVLPTIGSKELIAALPTQLGVRPGRLVVVPHLAYPTYEIGALLAGAQIVRADDPAELDDATSARVGMIWLNSPSNPTGAVLDERRLTAIVAWARQRGVPVAADECYIDLGWEVEPRSILHPDVSGGDPAGLLAVHSLSKRSNLAGYRLGFVAGDPALVDAVLQVRRHAGLVVPGPVQAAGVAALSDDAPVLAQRSRYEARRWLLRTAVERVGFTVDHSEAGLYLWCTNGDDALAATRFFAEHGILVAPGTFYGPAGAGHVRLALTATDEHVATAAARLAR